MGRVGYMNEKTGESMITCNRCRYWNTELAVALDEGSAGVCERVDGDESDSHQFEMITRADDDSGLESNLHTGPLFGCVLGRPI